MKSNTNTIDRLIWIHQQKQMNSSFSASIRQASTSSQDIHDFSVQLPLANKHADCKLLNASVCKMALSKNLCYLTVLCSGDLSLQVLQDPGNCSNLRTLVYLEMDNLKVRGIPHSMMAPLAVGASRGVACVFATRKRALVYILDEVEI